MASDEAVGSPRRGKPPPRPSSRTSPSSVDDDAPVERTENEKAAAWDAIASRVMAAAGSAYEGTYTPMTRDEELEQLRRRLEEYRDENDSLGEAVRAMKAALDAANEDAANAETTRHERDTAKEELAKTKALLGKADATLRSLKDRVAEMEHLCLEQQDDVVASKQAMEAAEAKRAEAEGAAQASSEEAKAAQAMATELSDRVALLEADAEIKASQQGIIEGLEVALTEARQAATNASADRETFQSKWRAEWEAAKDGHAAELRGGRARMAMLEADLAELRETLRVERREWCGRRRELETRLCEALAQARRFREDQRGAAESLRIMVEHEDTLRTAARHQAEVVARLRGDAATSAARCEHVASHCAELIKERAAATRRAEDAEAAAHRAREEAREAWGNPAAAISRAVTGSPEGVCDVERVPTLLAAAVRGSHRSPDSFAAGMDPGGGGMNHGGGVHDSPSTPSPGGAPHTPPPAKWIHSIGEDVAEELIHALAREVADSRAREETLREELVAARDARNDARRALVREVHRVHELERLRVTDLSDLHTAEQKARSAMVTAWSLRDRLATAAAQVEGFEVDDDAAEKAAEIVETREDGWWPTAVADGGPERTIETIDDTPRPAARALDILASGGEDADAGDVHATGEDAHGTFIDPALVEEALEELAVEAAASSSKNSSPLDSDARPRTPDRDGADDVEEVPRRWAPPPKLVLEARHEEPRSSMFAPM